MFGPSAQWSLWYAHHITRRVFPATSTAAPPASPPLASPRRVLRGSRDGCPPPLEDEHLLVLPIRALGEQSLHALSRYTRACRSLNNYL